MFAVKDKEGRTVAFWATPDEFRVLLKYLPDSKLGEVQARYSGVPIRLLPEIPPDEDSCGRMSRIYIRVKLWLRRLLD